MSRVFLISGTRKGLGKSLAEHYLALGDKVVGCSRGASSIQSENYLHFELDITDEKSVISMVRAVKKQLGRIDVLINNAGVAAMNHLITTPTQSAQQVINTNFMGTFLLTREVSKIMMRQKSGNLVNFSTVAVPLNLAGEAAYAASKAAVESFTKTSAKELAEFGIRVNALAPTPIKTDLIRNIPQDKLDELIAQQAIKRFGEVADVINLIDFFIQPESSFITGQIVYLGGVS